MFTEIHSYKTMEGGSIAQIISSRRLSAQQKWFSAFLPNVDKPEHAEQEIHRQLFLSFNIDENAQQSSKGQPSCSAAEAQCQFIHALHLSDE